MKKIGLFLFAFFSTLVFFPANVVFGEPGDEYIFYESMSGTTEKQFGHVSYRLGFCDRYTATTTFYISKFESKLYRYGTPTGNLQAVIWSPSGNPATAIGTSTNTIVASTLSTSYGSIQEFTFPDIEIASGTSFCIGIYYDTYNASNYIKTRSVSSGSLSCYVYSWTRTCAEYPSGWLDNRITAKSYVEPGVDCPVGYECYTVEDMATTTEAIYAVGYSIQLYLGLLILFFFGFLAFYFVKGYIR